MFWRNRTNDKDSELNGRWADRKSERDNEARTKYVTSRHKKGGKCATRRRKTKSKIEMFGCFLATVSFPFCVLIFDCKL